jgi:hypothetical protein
MIPLELSATSSMYCLQKLATKEEISLRLHEAFAILKILQLIFNFEKLSSHSGALTTIKNLTWKEWGVYSRQINMSTTATPGKKMDPEGEGEGFACYS